MFCEPAYKVDGLTLIHLRYLMHVMSAKRKYNKLWIYIKLYTFKIFQGSFFNAVLHDVSMQFIIENYAWVDKKNPPAEAINFAENGQNLAKVGFLGQSCYYTDNLLKSCAYAIFMLEVNLSSWRS